MHFWAPMRRPATSGRLEWEVSLRPIDVTSVYAVTRQCVEHGGPLFFEGSTTVLASLRLFLHRYYCLNIGALECELRGVILT